MPSDQQRFQFTGRQQLVHQSLAAKSSEFAELYECALRSLADNANPGRVFLAAHSIREMTGGLPKILDLPVLADLGRLGDQVDALQTAWESALRSSCHHDGRWSGAIDRYLERLLGRLQKFVQWSRESRPKRKDVVTNFLRRADPAGLPLPESLETPRTERWLELQDYFVRTAHRTQTTSEEFQSYLDELEQFLLEVLYRQPSQDFSAIDAILHEETSND